MNKKRKRPALSGGALSRRVLFYAALCAALCAMLCGCAQPTVREYPPAEREFPTAAYISRTSETEKPAPETIPSEPEASGAGAAPAQKENGAEANGKEPEPSGAQTVGEQAPKGTITLLGPNMVYTGESFAYRFETENAPENNGAVVWECRGDAGKIAADGEFSALKKGTVTLSVTDTARGLRDTLTVHVVETAADVDFVPEVNGIPIVNKTYPLPADYSPGDLTPETYEAFGRLVAAAAADQIEITFVSGFRSYEYQQSVHDRWVERYGEETADRLSARAGHSEHQLGLAIDVNSILLDFADTPEGIWLRENCTKFGFIIRYQYEKEPITGYIYEPWHIRYLGTELAEKVTESGLSLEEYLGIDSYYRDEAPSEQP